LKPHLLHHESNTVRDLLDSIRKDGESWIAFFAAVFLTLAESEKDWRIEAGELIKRLTRRVKSPNMAWCDMLRYDLKPGKVSP
jgi:hypothetical protein